MAQCCHQSRRDKTRRHLRSHLPHRHHLLRFYGDSVLAACETQRLPVSKPMSAMQFSSMMNTSGVSGKSEQEIKNFLKLTSDRASVHHNNASECSPRAMELWIMAVSISPTKGNRRRRLLEHSHIHLCLCITNANRKKRLSHISFVFVYHKRKSKKKRLTRSKLPPKVKKLVANRKYLRFSVSSSLGGRPLVFSPVTPSLTTLLFA